MTCATVQNLTRNLCIFIRQEGLSLTSLLHIFTYWFCHSCTAFLMTHTTSIEEMHSQDTAISHLQTWEDRVGKRLPSLPLSLLYFILFKICRDSFLQTGSDTAKNVSLLSNAAVPSHLHSQWAACRVALTREAMLGVCTPNLFIQMPEV